MPAACMLSAKDVKRRLWTVCENGDASWLQGFVDMHESPTSFCADMSFERCVFGEQHGAGVRVLVLQCDLTAFAFLLITVVSQDDLMDDCIRRLGAYIRPRANRENAAALRARCPFQPHRQEVSNGATMDREKVDAMVSQSVLRCGSAVGG